jgi:hypothetical protein
MRSICIPKLTLTYPRYICIGGFSVHYVETTCKRGESQNEIMEIIIDVGTDPYDRA